MFSYFNYSILKYFWGIAFTQYQGSWKNLMLKKYNATHQVQGFKYWEKQIHKLNTFSNSGWPLLFTLVLTKFSSSSVHYIGWSHLILNVTIPVIVKLEKHVGLNGILRNYLFFSQRLLHATLGVLTLYLQVVFQSSDGIANILFLQFSNCYMLSFICAYIRHIPF